MTMQQVYLQLSQWKIQAVILWCLAILASGCGSSNHQIKPAPGGESVRVTPSDSNADINLKRQRFLEMYARAYFPGRTGQLLVVPREGDIITRPDPNVVFMHGSPWPYDVSIPILFAGSAVRNGGYSMVATQQDVAPTLATALGMQMPRNTTGRALPIYLDSFTRPRVVMLLVLDGMRRDYFDRYGQVMPTLTSLRRNGAWFDHAEMNVLPTNTAVGHSTIATGTDPCVHGITGVSAYDFKNGKRHDFFANAMPQDLITMNLADLWQFATAGKAIILAQGSIDRAATPLAGHGACQLNGATIVLASYDKEQGQWKSNSDCFRLPDYLKDQNAQTLWSSSKEWMGHTIDSNVAVQYSGLFPAFEANAMFAMMEHESIGIDDVPDLILLNFKGADFVGHKYGPDSDELRTTLAEIDRQLTRLIGVLKTKTQNNYLIAVTADHGMPSEPPTPDRRHYAPDIVNLLHEKFDPKEKRIVTSYEPENAQIFVDEARLAQLGLTLRDLAVFLESQPFIFAVFTTNDVLHAKVAIQDKR